MSEKSNKKIKKTGIGVAVWCLGLLLLLIFFLVNKDKIFTNLKQSAFFDKVAGTTPEFIENHQIPEKKETVTQPEDDVIQIKVQETHKPITETPEETAAEKTEGKQEAKPEQKTETKPAQAEKTEAAAEKKQESKPVAKTELELCWVVIDSDGSVNRKLVKRSVPKNDSPLTTAINLLLQGPDTTIPAEKNCMSLIPAGTKLLGVSIKDGVAYLSFNDKFEFNSYGAEGYVGQLSQIVYTATVFPTVNSVRFLIEGEKRDYLGSEGQWIGSPLSRNSF